MQSIQQPPGTVEILLCHPPPGFAKQGMTYGVLAAAGYQQDVEVVAEFVGGDSQLGAAATTLPCLNTVVAWVRPPPGDRYLRKLPDAFDHSLGCTRCLCRAGKQAPGTCGSRTMMNYSAPCSTCAASCSQYSRILLIAAVAPAPGLHSSGLDNSTSSASHHSNWTKLWPGAASGTRPTLCAAHPGAIVVRSDRACLHGC